MKVLFEQFPQIYTIVEKIIQNKGKAFLVGGAVRDYFLGCRLKDIDIEIHHMTEPQLETLLQEYGVVSTVGKSFGVLRVNGIHVDWSLPRSDSAGRKPTVIIDPFMPIEQALRRRDLTMNAMAIDIETDISL